MTFHVIAVDCLISGIYLIVLALNNAIGGTNLLVNFTALRFAAYGVMAFFVIFFNRRDHLLKFPRWVSPIVIGGVGIVGDAVEVLSKGFWIWRFPAHLGGR
jgi:hypothetical protein